MNGNQNVVFDDVPTIVFSTFSMRGLSIKIIFSLLASNQHYNLEKQAGFELRLRGEYANLCAKRTSYSAASSSCYCLSKQKNCFRQNVTLHFPVSFNLLRISYSYSHSLFICLYLAPLFLPLYFTVSFYYYRCLFILFYMSLSVILTVTFYNSIYLFLSFYLSLSIFLMSLSIILAVSFYHSSCLFLSFQLSLSIILAASIYHSNCLFLQFQLSLSITLVVSFHHSIYLFLSNPLYHSLLLSLTYPNVTSLYLLRYLLQVISCFLIARSNSDYLRLLMSLLKCRRYPQTLFR